MRTQLSSALDGRITREMRIVARQEHADAGDVMERVGKGVLVIPSNGLKPPRRVVGIGRGLRTKVNANIGTSPDSADLSLERRKLRAALDAGTDTVMDLSIGGDIRKIRRSIMSVCPAPLGTVPIYQATVHAASEGKGIVSMDADAIFNAIEEHAMDGVDFMTVHCGVTTRSLNELKKTGRVMGIVSRGGSFLATWMLHNRRENPLYEQYDRLLGIARRYDITLSLGDGLRPGCLADANDRAQLAETRILGQLAARARQAGVQVMIEGPGHVPMHKIRENIRWQKRVCDGAPYYVLGPLVTDVVPGHDHITGAIGGAIAAWHGADFLCYVTPSEHLSLPTPGDVRQGVIASRIAAHAADIAKGLEGAEKWDEQLSRHRFDRDWKRQISMSMDPAKAKRIRKKSRPGAEDVCTMCGEYCAIKQVEGLFRKRKRALGGL
ncbi:MAG: phosphomethylpyrimidine synthase ThiC [Candidatus Aenigmarchaeota archaeon]|nr:phosphomethylpyrimidine synthase ThiC [Candidatus Aenigmarchaeota archaeon]